MREKRTTTRAAVYLRMSKDDELGIDRQREDALKLCADKGWSSTEYEDNDRSASNGKARPAYAQMLTDIRNGAVDAVVVWDLDRLHRRPIELEEFIDLADAKHLALATITGECDLSTHNGRLYARIKGAVARAEMDQKSHQAETRRQAEGRRRRAVVVSAAVRLRRAGAQARRRRQADVQQQGQAALRDADPGPGRVRSHPRRLLRGAEREVRCTASCRTWNDAGLLTPRGNLWRGTQVRQVLVSPRNAGLRTYQGDERRRDGSRQGRSGRRELACHRAARHLAGCGGRPGRTPTASAARAAPANGCCPTSRPVGCAGRAWRPASPNVPGRTRSTCARAATRSPATVPRSTRTCVEVIVGRLSRPDAVELTTPEQRDDLDELREKARALRARLDALAIEFADGDLTP